MTVPHEPLTLGVGFGWRDSLAGFTVDRARVDFVEVMAEHLPKHSHVPTLFDHLRKQGTKTVVHGLSLSLGGASPVERSRVELLASVAETTGAVLVSEHAAFVRAGRVEAGHLLPIPRTRDGLAALVRNVRRTQAALAVPLAVENSGTVLRWPADEFSVGEFLTELVEQTDCWLLLDLANLIADRHNHQVDPYAELDRLPLERVAYVHVAGGVVRDGLYHDTHRHRVPDPVWDLLRELQRRHAPPGVLLEWDGDFPPESVLLDELATIRRITEGPSEATRPSSSPAVSNAIRTVDRGEEGGDLAAAQRDLIRALVDDKPLPPGFDPHQARATAEYLATRRPAGRWSSLRSSKQGWISEKARSSTRSRSAP